MPRSDERLPARDLADHPTEVLTEEAGEERERRKIVAITVSCFVVTLRRFEAVEMYASIAEFASSRSPSISSVSRTSWS